MLETLKMLFRLFAFTCPCSKIFTMDHGAVLSAGLRHIIMSDNLSKKVFGYCSFINCCSLLLLACPCSQMFTMHKTLEWL